MPPTRAVADGIALLDAATARLITTLEALDEAALLAPCLLPGWSRAHLVTHLARNADALAGQFLAASAGVTRSMYPSRELRNADIDSGATRPPALVVQDARAAADRFSLHLAALPETLWTTSVAHPMLPGMTLADLPVHRAREVEAHHVDLGTNYTFTDTPAEMQRAFLAQIPVKFAGSALADCVVVATDLGLSVTAGDGSGPVISGPAAALLTWALGRGAVSGLTSSTGEVPASPGWG